MNHIRTTQGLEDFQLIEQLAQSIYPETYAGLIPQDHITFLLNKYLNAEFIYKNVSEHEHVYFLLLYEKQEIGFLGLYIENKTLVLNQLYILQSFRSLGVGSKALLKAYEWAKHKKCQTIKLTVLQQNTKAIAFYQNQGFEIKASLEHHFENGHTMQGYSMMRFLDA